MQCRHVHKHLIVLLFALFLFSDEVIGQDLHYSQFYNSPQNYNPAQTGVFNGDHRFILSHRDQWRYVPVPWTTFSGAYDMSIRPYNAENHFYGLGLNINYDKQGDSRLNLLNLSVNGAYHRILNSKNILSLGANLGFATKGFETKSLRWDKQWDGDVFDTTLPSQETFQNTERVNYLETGLGVNYRYQKSARTHVDLGVAALHLVEPTASFYGTEATKLPRRISLSGVGNFKVADALDIQLHALHQIQGKYRETIFGGLAKIYVNQDRGKELQLHLGLGYRTSKSFIPTVAIQWSQWYLGANLDIDRTAFNQALNSSRGAYELHLRYIIQNVKPFRYKNCPIL